MIIAGIRTLAQRAVHATHTQRRCTRGSVARGAQSRCAREPCWSGPSRNKMRPPPSAPLAARRAPPLLLMPLLLPLMLLAMSAVPGRAQPAADGTARTSTEELDADSTPRLMSEQPNLVRAQAEGGNCRCKCVVRPLGHGACERLRAASAAGSGGRPVDSYAVETVTAGGSDCRCACSAPPASLNPCEAEWRLDRLKARSPDLAKLSSLSEILEGALYSVDLLKIHSFVTRLTQQMTKLEEAVNVNLTRENEVIKESIGRLNGQMHKYENYTDIILGIKKEISSIGLALLQKDSASTQDVRAQDAAGPAKAAEASKPAHGKAAAAAAASKKQEAAAKVAREKEMRGKETRGKEATGKTGVQTRAAPPRPRAASVPAGRAAVLREVKYYRTERGDERHSDARHRNTVLAGAEGQPSHHHHHYVGGSAGRDEAVADSAGPTTTAATTTTTTRATTTTTTTQSTTTTTRPTTTTEPPPEPTAEAPSSTCYGTLSTVAAPVQHNSYGRSEGAWMKDPLASDGRIFVTNYYYGNSIVEFRGLDSFKEGRWSNIYKLPYNWIGTGHVIYNGSLFYNRAFSRHIIKYDLRARLLASWALLPDAVYEETTPWRWRGHSDIDFAADETGLWVIYPSVDDETTREDVIVLSRLNASDLSTQRETTWRTSLRRGHYGNCFVVCGVLYAVDEYNRRNATVFYAYDTHTSTQVAIRIPFTNEFGYTTQIDYNPGDKVIYAWDNGRQVTYNVTFIY
uniref:Olfactomedin-like protein 2A isoform X1 n=1 Tax=Petromyzon marinus TaxID=7757 RepID=A0AAJ7XCA3_PETMA|nr:olfactomedin-like protein 2A isoform X1 [Petromyzon marinus]